MDGVSPPTEKLRAADHSQQLNTKSPNQKRCLLVPVINKRGEEPEQEGWAVNPELMERHGVMRHRPDYRNMLYCDETPAQ